MTNTTERNQVARPRGILRSTSRARRQRGQALPLGAIGLMVGALTVIATLNLGQAVHEKIRLQNSADAAAYSLAALEARSFNFIALTNRTQIVHYNTAMAMQSYLSYTGFCLGIFGTMRDLLVDLDLAVQTGCSYPYPANVPYIALRLISKPASIAAGIVFKALNTVYKLLHNKTLGVPAIVQAMSYFNKYAIWQMQMVRALQVNAHLVTGMQDFVQANDPAMTYTARNNWFNILMNNVLNSLEFQATWDRGASLNPFWLDALTKGVRNVVRDPFPDPENDENKEAYAVMTELANASRSHKNIYDRSGFVMASWGLSSIIGSKMGQTKLVEEGDPAPEIDEIRKDPIHYAIGDSLASDDYLTFGLGLAMLPPLAWAVILPRGTSMGEGILADKDGGKHYKYTDPGSGTGGAPGGYMGVVTIPPATGAIKNTYTKDGDSDHKWPGLAPFFKFRPSSESNSDFNQPSTWMFLNKHHSAFQSGSGSGGRPWHYNFKARFNQGSNTGITSEGERIGGGDVTGEVSLDTTIGGERNSYLFEGLNVVSRGMAYYHRPGVWKEPPNMFNPFWRARLAPVGAKLMNVFDRFLGSKIKTSSDSAVVQIIVNLVRNFVSDFFLRVVTSVMTH